MVRLPEMTKNGVTVEVEFSAMRKTFQVVVGDQLLESETWKGLESKVAKATKRVTKKVAVPFTRVSLGEFRDGTATGLHSANGNVLVTWSNGTREQMTRTFGYRPETFHPLSDADRSQLVRLRKEFEAARDALDAWEDVHRVDLKEAVNEALNVAEAGGGGA